MSTTLNLGVGVSPAHATVDAENPWPGLETFREGDKPFFRGRDPEAGELAQRVLTERLCTLYGVSGLGKSSLLQAGLFPRVRDELFPVFIRLRHHEGAAPPRQQVLKEVAEQAALRGVSVPELDEGRTLWETFHPSDHAFWTSDFRPVVPLLVFDQFEEAFTTGRDTPARQRITAAFLDELCDLIEGRPSRELKARVDAREVRVQDYAFNRHSYKVLLVLREDYLAELEALAATAPSLMHNRMRLTPLSGTAALEVTRAGGPALVPPADAAGEPGVGELIVRLVASEDDDPSVPLDRLVVDPALLSLFCRELNELRKTRGRDSITPDLVKGNRNQILAEYYARTLNGVDAGVRVPVRVLVEDRLVTVGGHRNSEAWDNAVKTVGEEALQALIRGRLIRRDRQRIELTHDVLTGVVTQSRDQRKAEEDAAAATARQREQAHKEKAEAEQRAQEERARADRLEAAAQQLKTQRARRLVAVFGVVATVFILLAVYANLQRQRAQANADTATQQRMLAEANADTAKRQRALAEANADSANRQRALALANADSANRQRERADSARAAAVAAGVRLDAANQQLSLALAVLRDTANLMRAAQDSVRRVELASTVQAEAADYYMRLAGLVNRRQLLQDSIREQLIRQQLGQLDDERRQATSRIAQVTRRAEVLERVLCRMDRPRSGGEPGDSAVAGRLRKIASDSLGGYDLCSAASRSEP
ncbi:MAG TPA: hypothetical protein VFS20_08420 [Longimicrobium sp.]|nr:hypothetical protein [Longimicrobium sp.]